MKRSSLAFATSIVLLSGALLAGCASAPPVGKCDTSQSLGACAVTVRMQNSRLVLCPVKDAAAPPMCMKTTVDIARAGNKPQPASFLLEPSQCVPLNTEIISATASSCEAFAVRARGEQQLAASSDKK